MIDEAKKEGVVEKKKKKKKKKPFIEEGTIWLLKGFFVPENKEIHIVNLFVFLN